VPGLLCPCWFLQTRAAVTKARQQVAALIELSARGGDLHILWNRKRQLGVVGSGDVQERQTCAHWCADPFGLTLPPSLAHPHKGRVLCGRLALGGLPQRLSAL